MAQKKKNYWTEEIRISELKNVMVKIGHFPTQHDLEKIGRCDLKQTITRHNGLSYYRKILGLEKWKKPTTTDFNKMSEDLHNIIKNINHFPTVEELKNMRRLDILYYIRKTGGINKHRKDLGYKLLIVDDGHYTMEQTICYLNTIKNQLGHFPTLIELKKNKMWCKITYGIKLNGGMNVLRKAMRYPILKERNKTHTEESVSKFLEEYMHKHNIFPTRSILEKNGNTKIVSAISVTGGFNYYRSKFGISISKQKNGFWDYDRTYQELKNKIEFLGYYPSMGEINKKLVHAIFKN